MKYYSIIEEDGFIKLYDIIKGNINARLEKSSDKIEHNFYQTTDSFLISLRILLKNQYYYNKIIKIETNKVISENNIFVVGDWDFESVKYSDENERVSILNAMIRDNKINTIFSNQYE
jgi:hypothetical protein